MHILTRVDRGEFVTADAEGESSVPVADECIECERAAFTNVRTDERVQAD